MQMALLHSMRLQHFLVKPILVMPATNALSERSYSALKKNLELP